MILFIFFELFIGINVINYYLNKFLSFYANYFTFNKKLKDNIYWLSDTLCFDYKLKNKLW